MYKYIKKRLGIQKKEKKEEKGSKKAPPRPLVSQPSLQRMVEDGSREQVAEKIEDVYSFEKELGR